ncbi:hypothetical protein SASPL_139805 [Salvia splendens]|uniref:Uncharacterized protein n=1 Tax=Salvia splendens TaxID=180675 RepID=A0A8X8WNU5_SALSN|nr:hypothetical protein SASPL_139805 [Salvia splendens]
MTEVGPPPSCRAALAPAGFRRDRPILKLKWQGAVTKPLRLMKIDAQIVNPTTYSSRISTDIPLYEIPGASFDEYLEDKPRVFKAIFPDKRRSDQINQVFSLNFFPFIM